MSSKSTYRTFGDGRGFVPAKRHINPDGSIGGWVADTASVADTVWIGKDATVTGKARVTDYARVRDTARVSDHAQVTDKAQIADNAQVYGNAHVSGRAKIKQHAIIFDDAMVYGDTQICDQARVYNNAKICQSATINKNARVCGNARVAGTTLITDNAIIGGKAEVVGGLKITGDTAIYEGYHAYSFEPKQTAKSTPPEGENSTMNPLQEKVFDYLTAKPSTERKTALKKFLEKDFFRAGVRERFTRSELEELVENRDFTAGLCTDGIERFKAEMGLGVKKEKVIQVILEYIVDGVYDLPSQDVVHSRVQEMNRIGLARDYLCRGVTDVKVASPAIFEREVKK